MADDSNKTSAEPPVFTAEAIRELASLLNETGLTEIEIETQGARVRIAREAAVQNVIASAPAALAPAALAPSPAAPAPASPTAASGTDAPQHPGSVTSPMVGTVYLAPEPGSPDFVSEGDTVSQGQTLLIVEAMKTMNPITAPKAGKVLKILVANEEPVEYGQPLIIVE